MQNLLIAVKDVMIECALEKCNKDDGARRAEIECHKNKSPFDGCHPDIGFAEALLRRLGLGMMVRTTSDGQYHVYAEGEACAVFDYVNGNHFQSPVLIPRERAAEVRASSPYRKRLEFPHPASQ